MAGGQNEAITIGPIRISGVIFHGAGPQHIGQFRCLHGHSRVAGIGLLHSVHSKKPDGVDALFFKFICNAALSVQRIRGH